MRIVWVEGESPSRHTAHPLFEYDDLSSAVSLIGEPQAHLFIYDNKGSNTLVCERCGLSAWISYRRGSRICANRDKPCSNPEWPPDRYRHIQSRKL
jgi:hypothetical protein